MKNVPSERELCDKFCLSRDTVRQAIFQLEKKWDIFIKNMERELLLHQSN